MSVAAIHDVPERAVRAPWVPLLCVVVAGAAAAWALAAPPAESPGARRLASPEILLGAFDAVVFLLLVRPGSRDAPETIVLLLAAAPFHAAISAAAGAGPGHLGAIAVSAAAWAAAALVAARGGSTARLGAVMLTAATFALPLAAYGLAEFVRLPVRAAFFASPLTGPVVLARRAATASVADAVPALAAAALIIALAGIARRRAEPGA